VKFENISKNCKKAPPMADSSFSLPPLCERISYTNYFLRAVYLTVLGLFFSLLLHRIRHTSEYDNVWLVAFFCESCFFLVCLLITCLKWSPADTKPFPDRLDERYHFRFTHKSYIQILFLAYIQSLLLLTLYKV